VNRPLRPTDTLHEPHEPIVEKFASTRMWITFLAGPVLFITHFMVVYLPAEASCAADRSARMWFIGPDGLTWLILVTTAVFAAAAIVAAWVAWRSTGTRMLAGAGLLMSVGSAATILAVGLPVAVLGPC
jgi:uncharacterized membrane protein